MDNQKTNHQRTLFQADKAQARGIGSGEQRDELDRYYSAPWWIDLLLDEACVAEAAREPLTILEPFAGRDLSLAKRLREHGHYVTTADIDQGAPVEMHVDSFEHNWPTFDAVVSNPPFNVKQGGKWNKASDAVRIFVPRTRFFTAMLMRISFLEPCSDREDILEQYAPDHVVILPRHSFKKTAKSSTDMMTCAWFIWTSARRAGIHTFRSASKAELGRYELAWKFDQKRRTEK